MPGHARDQEVSQTQTHPPSGDSAHETTAIQTVHKVSHRRMAQGTGRGGGTWMAPRRVVRGKDGVRRAQQEDEPHTLRWPRKGSQQASEGITATVITLLSVHSLEHRECPEGGGPANASGIPDN